MRLYSGVDRVFRASRLIVPGKLDRKTRLLGRKRKGVLISAIARRLDLTHQLKQVTVNAANARNEHRAGLAMHAKAIEYIVGSPARLLILVVQLEVLQ